MTFLKLFITSAIAVAALTGAEIGSLAGQTPAEQYDDLQSSLSRGWNTWDTRSVLRHVILPYGAAIDISLISPSGDRMDHVLIGERGNGVAQTKPGPHSYDGSYTSIEVRWQDMGINVESAAEGLNNVLIITPLKNSQKGEVVVSLRNLWQRANNISLSDDSFVIEPLADHQIIKGAIIGNGLKRVGDKFHLPATETVTITCGDAMTTSEARKYVDDRRNAFIEGNRAKYDQCYEEYNAMQTVLGWDTIYDPTTCKVITPVSRIWNIGWGSNPDRGGFVLFCWDTYFASLMLSTDNKELAYANAAEITNGITEDGFVPNFYTEGNYKSRDRSQPPVGSMAVWTIYQKYHEKWFLELLYDKLLRWNRWWDKNRETDGLLCWGSNPYKPVTYRYFEFASVNDSFGGALESGLDNSQMYDDIPFDEAKHQQKLNDVGLSSLYIADCRYLAKIANELEHRKDARELTQRSERYAKRLAGLWDPERSFYYNRRTDTGEASSRISPTNFYPMIAQVPDEDQAKLMLQRHLLDPDEFWGTWVIPATPRNDPAFKDNTYWRGRIWAPLNFLVYMGLRNYKSPEIVKVREELARKSSELLLKSWLSDGYVFENYNATTGVGDDVDNSDKFYHWGALLGYINLIEQDYY